MLRKSVLLVAGLFAILPAFGQAAYAQKTGVVKIGVNEPLSGNFVAVGLPPTVAIRFATKEINDKGGFQVGDTTYKLQVVEIDNQSTTASAVAGMIRLVEDEKVKFTFGPTLGALGAQTAQIGISGHVIQFAAATTWQQSGMLSDPKNALMFGTQMSAEQATAVQVAAFKKINVKKVAYISGDDDTTKGVYPFFDAAAKKAGLTVVPVLFPPNTSDYSPYVTRAKAENVDGIFFLQPQASGSEVLRAVANLAPGITMFGGFNLNPDVALKTAVGRPVSVPFFTMSVFPPFAFPPNDKVKSFAERISAFEPKIVGTNSGFTFYSYDYVYMLVEAMKKVGSVDDVDKIASALSDMTYDGVVGRLCFGKTMRTAVLDGGLLIVRDGKVESEVIPSTCK